jgi:hypothetical protein
MGTYKVIQDIEAEDKLLGPLSLRQFIYAIIVFALGFVAFTLGKINPLLALPLLFPMGLFGLLAAPFGRDQSSEVWLLAKIRFSFKPRRRIWDQAGVKDYVTITVPKKIEHRLTDGLDQTQVKSRLKALAETLDSRGWAVKNATMSAGIYAAPMYSQAFGGQSIQQGVGSDRLVSSNTLQNIPTIASDVTDADDVLDETYNPTAQKLGVMIEQSEQARRQNLINTMQQATPPVTATTTIATQQPVAVVAATNTDEAQLLDKIHQNQAADRAAGSHIKRIPTAQEIAANQKAEADAAVRTEELSRLAVNDDLDVATIARQAHKDDESHDLGNDEVVISLH